MNKELDDILQHHGVKGMKWGKRTADAVKTRVDSVKREHSWNKTLKNASNMSTKDIQKTSQRAQLENDMKRLSKERGVGSSKDKKDYLKRGEMSDQELHRKVQRLRVKSNLNRTAKDATKSQREVAKKVIQIAAPLALGYAMTGSINKRDVVNAAINTAVNAGGEKARFVKSLADQAVRTKKVKHSDEFEDTLQHHGVKGMHWGVRKKVQKAVKAHRAKQNKRVLDYHEKHKGKKLYGKLYAQNSKRYKSHLAAARKSREQVFAVRAQQAKVAAIVGVAVASQNKHHIAKASKVLGKVAQNPDNIRKAKNVVQALKRSPIRYVDGKKMKNVIN